MRFHVSALSRWTVAVSAGMALAWLPACRGDGHSAFPANGLAIAVGGEATQTFAVTALATVQSVVSSDSSVLAVSDVTQTQATLTGLKAGEVSLTLLDSSGAEIDSTSVTVAPVARLDLQIPQEVTTLPGETFTYTAYAYDASGVALDGANVTYALTGSLAPSGPGMTTGSPGDGRLTASVGSVSSSVLVHVIAPSAVDSFTFSPATVTIEVGGSSSASYTLRAGGQTLRTDGSELDCASTNPAVAAPTIFPFTGGLGGDLPTTGSLGMSSASSGTATIACVVGNVSASVAVVASSR
jgi:hypothetical protein